MRQAEGIRGEGDLMVGDTVLAGLNRESGNWEN